MENLNERMARLEERLAWLERHVALQDRAMLELGEQCDRLRAELKTLQQRSASGPGATSDDAERPPHY